MTRTIKLSIVTHKLSAMLYFVDTSSSVSYQYKKISVIVLFIPRTFVFADFGGRCFETERWRLSFDELMLFWKFYQTQTWEILDSR